MSQMNPILNLDLLLEIVCSIIASRGMMGVQGALASATYQGVMASVRNGIWYIMPRKELPHPCDKVSHITEPPCGIETGEPR